MCVCVYTIFPDFQIFIQESGTLRTPRTNYMTDTAHQRNSTLATKLQKISGQTPPRPDKFHKLTHSRPPEHTSTQSRADKKPDIADKSHTHSSDILHSGLGLRETLEILPCRQYRHFCQTYKYAPLPCLPLPSRTACRLHTFMTQWPPQRQHFP